MKLSLSWLSEFVTLPKRTSPEAIAEALTWRGFEVESITKLGDGVIGPLVVGRVLSIKPVVSPKKTVRLCQVDLGPKHGRRQIICGAFNFDEGDLVVVAPPGAVIAGGLKLEARQVYGHTSEGMIVSAAEVGVGDDHDGILVLDSAEAKVGANAAPLLGIGDEVFDVAVMPDRGYALSVRGLAREVAGALGVRFKDPARGKALSPARRSNVQGAIKNRFGCDRVVFARLDDVDAMAPSPAWLARRLRACGVRPLGLAIDVTNYLMLETGQPLHAFDAQKVSGVITVRNAKAGEKLETIDHVARVLNPGDLVIADAKGALSLAGVMGGAKSEISAETSSIIIEAAHFDSVIVAQSARRHRLSTEASRRFERGVDPELPAVVAGKAVTMLRELGGGRLSGVSEIDFTKPSEVLRFDMRQPARTIGADISTATAVAALKSVGCEITGRTKVRPPSWRPDLTDDADLVEEVARVWGYQNIPVSLPRAPIGRGLHPTQVLRKQVADLLANRGLVEVLNQPFLGLESLESLRVTTDDERRDLIALANPLNDQEPFFRSSLLPGLVATGLRNINRGNDELGLFEIGSVAYLPSKRAKKVIRPSLSRRPTRAEVGAVKALLPYQFEFVSGLVWGESERAGWWGSSRAANWAETVSLVREIMNHAHADLIIENGSVSPWHPGRCAMFRSNAGELVAIAGELHPGVCKDLGLPAGASAFELNLSVLASLAHPLDSVAPVSVMPVAKEDIALVVDESVNAADVEIAIREGAGDALEGVRLFDVYRSDAIGTNKKSLAFAMRFRSKDSTYSAEELADLRSKVLATAAAKVGATLRA